MTFAARGIQLKGIYCHTPRRILQTIIIRFSCDPNQINVIINANFYP